MTNILNIDEFKSILKNNRIAIFELYAPWCSKCKSLDSKLKELKLNIYKIDIDSEPFINDPLFESVLTIPCFWIYKNNKKKIVNGRNTRFIIDELKFISEINIG